MAQAKESNPAQPQEGPQASAQAPADQPVEGPVQVSEATFLAARLREALADSANWRQSAAELQLENARLRAQLAQVEIDKIDTTYEVGPGTALVGKNDGTYWKMPKKPQQG